MSRSKMIIPPPGTVARKRPVKIGGSVAIIIPATVLEVMDVDTSTEVDISYTDDGKSIVIKKAVRAYGPEDLRGAVS
jgi:antitoxin component of MazEF toxin-antitoxin module